MNSKISFSEEKDSIKSGAQLESENWQRRGIFGEPRLSELIAFYEELGYEVLVKALRRFGTRRGTLS